MKELHLELKVDEFWSFVRYTNGLFAPHTTVKEYIRDSCVATQLKMKRMSVRLILSYYQVTNILWP